LVRIRNQATNPNSLTLDRCV